MHICTHTIAVHTHIHSRHAYKYIQPHTMLVTHTGWHCFHACLHTREAVSDPPISAALLAWRHLCRHWSAYCNIPWPCWQRHMDMLLLTSSSSPCLSPSFFSNIKCWCWVFENVVAQYSVTGHTDMWPLAFSCLSLSFFSTIKCWCWVFENVVAQSSATGHTDMWPLVLSSSPCLCPYSFSIIKRWFWGLLKSIWQCCWVFWNIAAVCEGIDLLILAMLVFLFLLKAKEYWKVKLIFRWNFLSSSANGAAGYAGIQWLACL